MPRTLVPKVEVGTAATEAAADDWPTRLAKYIPAESITLFSTLTATLSNELEGANNDKTLDLTIKIHGLRGWIWALIILLGCFIFNLIYLHTIYVKKFPDKSSRQKIEIPHLVVSSVGFLIWVYVTRSPLFEAFYITFVAYLLGALFTTATYKVQPIISLEDARASHLIADDSGKQE